MLEAERAGAKALVVFMDDWKRNGPEWKTLRGVHEDEAHNCALIGEQLKKRGHDYSHATGEFYGKAVAVKDPKQRIAFLVRGLKWAVRKFDEALPQIPEPAVRDLVLQMRARHLRTIDACEALLGALG